MPSRDHPRTRGEQITIDTTLNEGEGPSPRARAHSKAALNDDFAELMRSSRQPIVAVDVDEDVPRWRPSDAGRTAPAVLVVHAPGADRLFGTGVQPGDLQEVLDEAAQVADPGP